MRGKIIASATFTKIVQGGSKCKLYLHEMAGSLKK